MFFSLQPQLGAAGHARRKAVAGGQSLRELAAGHHRGIHLASQRRLHRGERARQVCKASTAQNHQVDVAACAFSATGHAAVDEGQVHLGCERFEGLAQHVDQAGRLAEQLRQFGMHRVRHVGAVVHLAPHLLTQQQAHVGQQPQLAVQGARRCPGQPGQFAHV